MPTESLTFGELVRRRRIARGLTQEQVAERFGVRQSTVHRWEKGSVPDRAIFGDVAEFLGLGVGEMWELALAAESGFSLGDVMAELFNLRDRLEALSVQVAELKPRPQS